MRREKRSANAVLSIVMEEWQFVLSTRISTVSIEMFAATTKIERTSPGGTPPIVQPYVAEARSRLDRAYTSYGFTPVVGLSGSFLVF